MLICEKNFHCNPEECPIYNQEEYCDHVVEVDYTNSGEWIVSAERDSIEQNKWHGIVKCGGCNGLFRENGKVWSGYFSGIANKIAKSNTIISTTKYIQNEFKKNNVNYCEHCGAKLTVPKTEL